MVNPYSKISLLFFGVSLFLPFFSNGVMLAGLLLAPFYFFSFITLLSPLFLANLLFVFSFFGNLKRRKWVSVVACATAFVLLFLLLWNNDNEELQLGAGAVFWLAAFVMNVIRHAKKNVNKKVAL